MKSRQQRKAENIKAVNHYIDAMKPFYTEKYKKGRSVKVRRDGCFEFGQLL